LPDPRLFGALYVADGRAVYTALNPMIGGTLDFRGISENWNETLRGAASIKAGTVAPSALMRRLAAYPKQNALAKTLREIGRLERTLFTLDWISDPALRRRSNAGLNKGEARNALARAVFFHRLGEILTAPSKISDTGLLASISPSRL
jgi:TnpA family transposase